MICRNCDHIFQGDFCSSCGQKSNVWKMNFRYLIDEIINSVFQVDQSIIFTIKALSTRLGYSIKKFIKGKRKQYFKPYTFVLLISSIYVLSLIFPTSVLFQVKLSQKYQLD